MGSFILKRVIYLIPTVFLVLIIAFTLSKIAPGDQVVSLLNLEGKTDNLGRTEYNRQYLRIQSQLGQDRPVFYFGWQPNYYPSQVHQIVPKAYRQNLLFISQQTKDWTVVHSYHEALQSAIVKSENRRSENRGLTAELLKLQYKNTSISIDRQMDKVLQKLSNQAEDDLVSAISDLQLATQNLATSKTEMYYPSIKWNGSSCQFHYWFSNLFNPQGNKSLQDGTPSVKKIASALKWTLSITITSLLLTILLSILMGYYQVKHPNRLFNKVSSILSFGIFAIPTFWFATLMVVFFTTDDYGSWTNIFPTVGIKYWMINEPFYKQFLASTGQLILPIICMTLPSLAFLSAQVKTSLTESMSLPFINVARAKGLSENDMLKKHGLRNAALPLITLITGAIPSTLVGSVIIEVIFNIPGVGRLMLHSITNLDWPVCFYILIVVGIVTVLSYLLADVLYMLLFPKMAADIIKNNG